MVHNWLLRNIKRASFKIARRTIYPWLFIFIVLAVLSIVHFNFGTDLSVNLFFSVIGIAGGFVHFLYSQHIHNTERFIDLFREFNRRYDKINDRLNALVRKETSFLLSFEDKQLLFDYFNLCAEEYLYFKAGYIDRDVWQSWLKGMKYFASDSEIRKLWCEEINSGSYYGFTLKLIDETA